jgi:hypothetical protein
MRGQCLLSIVRRFALCLAEALRELGEQLGRHPPVSQRTVIIGPRTAVTTPLRGRRSAFGGASSTRSPTSTMPTSLVAW